MRKKVFGRQLKRGRGSRNALFRALFRALIEYERISTTKARARAVLPEIDHLVNLAKDGSTSSLRRLYAILGNDKDSVKKLSEVLAPRFADRKSGYIRLINLNPRAGDNAEMVRLEWVTSVSQQSKSPAKQGQKKEKKEVKKKSKL